MLSGSKESTNILFKQGANIPNINILFLREAYSLLHFNEYFHYENSYNFVRLQFMKSIRNPINTCVSHIYGKLPVSVIFLWIIVFKMRLVYRF